MYSSGKGGTIWGGLRKTSCRNKNGVERNAVSFPKKRSASLDCTKKKGCSKGLDQKPLRIAELRFINRLFPNRNSRLLKRTSRVPIELLEGMGRRGSSS